MVPKFGPEPRALAVCGILRDETIFLKPRNHPEAEARYQGGMTPLGGFRMTMVEVVVAAGAALGSACIFLAHAIEAYHAD